MPAAWTRIFARRVYRHLFLAQLLALFGTGLTTIALGLLAYEIAGASAGAVLGTAFAIKMVCYVTVSPLAGALAGRVPRRTLLVALDGVRALVVLALPFVQHAWQIYLLIVVLQSASAAFTSTYQALLPDVLPDEREYTRALSVSQLASTMENLLSPLLAAVLLSVVSFHWLFGGTALGFVGSALLVVSTRLPRAERPDRTGVGERLFAGVRVYLATPRLRGLLGACLTVAAAGAMVLVNTVNYVRDELGSGQSAVAVLFAANGVGTVLAALLVPRLLERVPERRVVLAGAAVLPCALLGAIGLSVSGSPELRWPLVLLLWSVVGAGTGLVLTPAGRVLRRSAHPGDRPAVYAAQFSLSHACWLVTYPIAGWLASAAGFTPAWTVLAALALAGLFTAALCWPRVDPEVLPHAHHGPPADRAHLRDAERIEDGVWVHAHPFVIDSEHPRWPARVL